MTAKEALELVFGIYDTAYGREQLTILNLGLSFEKTKECQEVLNQTLTELEELKVDVKRYFELSIFNLQQLSGIQAKEYWGLRDKLSKVGKP